MNQFTSTLNSSWVMSFKFQVSLEYSHRGLFVCRNYWILKKLIIRYIYTTGSWIIKIYKINFSIIPHPVAKMVLHTYFFIFNNYKTIFEPILEHSFSISLNLSFNKIFNLVCHLIYTRVEGQLRKKINP